MRGFGERVSWDVWVELIERSERALGGPEGLERMALLAASSPGRHPFQRVARLLSSPVTLYRLNSRWGVPNQYRNMRSTCVELGGGRLCVTFSIEASYRGSIPTFRATLGIMRALPLLIGLPQATLHSHEVSSHGARVILEPPPSQTLWSRSRRLGLRARGLGAMLDQLGQQELELADKRAVLVQQLEAQKQVEAALRGSEERWRALAENAPGTIVLLSAHGTVESINRTFHGMDAAALQGRPFRELFAEPGRSQLELAMQAVRHELAQRDVQVQVQEPASDGVWYSCRLGPMRGPDGEAKLSAFLIDITSRLRAEEALKQRDAELARAQKLEALGLLAGGVAHDFNNLLTIIQGTTELLLDRARSAASDQEDLVQIKRAGERAAQLTRQLLAFSRQQLIEPEVMHLGTLLQAFRGMLARLLGEDIQLQLVIAPELWHVKLDSGQVEQVLINLAVNARDAMPKGGTLKIVVRNRRTDEPWSCVGSTLEPGEYVELSVEDTGIGMDDDTRGRVFEPFYTTKQRGQGTGLGLAIVRGIASQSGGHLLVDSELGQGSRFRLLFPRSHEPIAPRREPERAPRLDGSETILLVEDDAQVRALASKILRRRGYGVIECSGAAEALATSRERHIDLLLSDVIMPEVSGPELARLITQTRPGLATLFMSGYAEHEIVHRGVLEPGVSLLTKPFGPDLLCRRVRQQLDERRHTKGASS